MQYFLMSTTYLLHYWAINFTFIEISELNEDRAYMAPFVLHFPEHTHFSEYRTNLDLIFITSEALSSKYLTN